MGWPVESSSTKEIVPGWTGSLKVAAAPPFTATLLLPLTGASPVIVGGVTSAGAAVVNDQDTGAFMALPARSWAPLTVAVYAVAVLSGEAGVKVAVRVALA